MHGACDNAWRTEHVICLETPCKSLGSVLDLVIVGHGIYPGAWVEPGLAMEHGIGHGALAWALSWCMVIGTWGPPWSLARNGR